MKKVLSLIIAVALTITLIPQWSSLVEASSYGLDNPRRANGITTWDCVWFGNYYQDNASKKEPIKWRVLSINGDDAFLLSDKVLDNKPYSKDPYDHISYTSWESCYLRNWLNNNFYNTAFSDLEKNDIVPTSVRDENMNKNVTDSVFLLSEKDIETVKYGFVSNMFQETKTRQCVPTMYAIRQGCEPTEGPNHAGNCCWYLRDLKYNLYGSYLIPNTCFIVYGGWYADYGGFDSPDGIRPALNIKLSSNSWKKAGTVVSEVKKKTAKKKSKKTSIKKIKAKKRALKVYWKKASGANGYQLKYSLKKNFKKSKTITIKKTKTTSKTIKKLKRKKRYYVKIRTYYWSYGYKKKSAWSKVKSKKTK